jgi:superfamily I DNA/RNA helicase
MKLTKEQRIIIDSILAGNDIVVNAVAGAGKTTTICSAVQELPANKRVLVLCYNTNLRTGTMNKINDPGVSVHTFHSFCHGPMKEHMANTDIGLIKLTEKSEEDRWFDCPVYDIVIVDEAQDLNDVYFKILCKILSARDELSTGRPQLVLIGDPMQSIYQFNGANSDYIVNPENYFIRRKFVRLGMTKSFRLTPALASFVNSCTSSRGIAKIRAGSKAYDTDPIILMMNPWSAANNVYDIIIKYLKSSKKHKVDDILILAHSVRSGKSKYTRPVIALANLLIDAKLPVHIAGNITSPTDTKSPAADDSISIMSFHQSKGLERKFVIVFDIDGYYFAATGEPTDIIPRTWYVAFTRSKGRLLIVHGSNNGQIPFMENQYNTCGWPSGTIPECREKIKATSIEDHIKYRPAIETYTDIKTLPKYIVGPILHEKYVINHGTIIGNIFTEYSLRCLHEQIDANFFIKEYMKEYHGTLNNKIDMSDIYIEAPWDECEYIIDLPMKIVARNVRMLVYSLIGVNMRGQPTTPIDISGYVYSDIGAVILAIDIKEVTSLLKCVILMKEHKKVFIVDILSCSYHEYEGETMSLPEPSSSL